MRVLGKTEKFTGMEMTPVKEEGRRIVVPKDDAPKRGLRKLGPSFADSPAFAVACPGSTQQTIADLGPQRNMLPPTVRTAARSP